MPDHKDHATWVSFMADEITDLRAILLADDPRCARLIARLDQYEAPATKDQAYRDAAEQQPFVREGECEIDDHAVVSASDDGAYVMAWVWVYAEKNEEDEICGQCNDPRCDGCVPFDTPSLDTSFHDHEMDAG